ncbi:nucleotidyl transferase AbiEii/AbiGii toxin family protein [Candidatus Gottesmanbacteria bacterium]|nr:nucleotidyl transferase AbiEii/AbiGii toxin family protein [Candidatus Gottesmanbacteria bacterium]
MYTNTLPENTQKILEKLKEVSFLKNFYLSGGTALTLQIGHRESMDLDFFSQKEFNPQELQPGLEKIGQLNDLSMAVGTLNCFLEKTQLQFLYYPYNLLEDKINWEGIYLSSVLDIACTKIITISARGSKKDFIDMYFLLKEYNLPFLFQKLKEKYPKTDYNEIHLLKSLVYFRDAETQPSPKIHVEIDWKQVKEEIKQKVKDFKI